MSRGSWLKAQRASIAVKKDKPHKMIDYHARESRVAELEPKMAEIRCGYRRGSGPEKGRSREAAKSKKPVAIVTYDEKPESAGHRHDGIGC